MQPWMAIAAVVATFVAVSGWAIVAVGKAAEDYGDPQMLPAHPGPDFDGKAVFISGPMTGYEDYNRDAFDLAEMEINARGAIDVYNPARFADDGSLPHEHYMAKTLHDLTEFFEGRPNRPYYDAVVLLEGWERSEGAKAEKAVAEVCGIAVYEWADCR